MTLGFSLIRSHRSVPRISNPHRYQRTKCCGAHPRSSSSTLYELLGVNASAGKPDLKQAYRELAQKYHPDVNEDDDNRQLFKALNLAYEVLSDTELKRTYDACGLSALGPRFSFLNNFLKSEVSEPPRAGSDVFIVAGLSLREAILGVEKQLVVDVMRNCKACQGSGMAAASNCSVCNGSGEILRYKPHPVLGKVALLGSCPGCRGKGCVQLEHCQTCQGIGRARRPKEMKVRIPAGVEVGSVVKVAGQGDPGRFGGTAGDLYVKVMVHSDHRVVRKGQDLHTDVEVNVFDAMLGTTLCVGTMRGTREIDVPPGTQHGDIFTVRGAGVPTAKGGIVEYGDHVFRVALRVPTVSCFSQASVSFVKEKLRHLAVLHEGESCSDAC